MQPNNNLVFYLAGDNDEPSKVSGEQNSIAEPVSSSDVLPESDVSSEASEQSLLSEHAPQIEELNPVDLDEVDWIATLENIRHQRRGDDVTNEDTAFANAAGQANVLKVTSMKTTQLHQPTASALAAGKDLEKLSYSLKEAQRLVKNTPATEYSAPKTTEAPVWSMEDLEKQIQSLSGGHTHEDIEAVSFETEPFIVDERTDNDNEFEAVLTEDENNQTELNALLDDLKAAAKQVPFDEYAVEATQLHSAPSQELIDKANEVAEKTALSLEERHKILDGFLSLWQHKREPDLNDNAERKVMFKEEWHAHNSDVLQAASESLETPEHVMWLKTQPEAMMDGEVNTDVTAVSDEVAVTLEQPEEATQQNMYAPVHVSIVTPELNANERLSVVSEQELLAQLAIKLKPYFVDMLAGLVRNELNRQTTALVQRLQDNINEEIPMLVDDVLQENLQNVLREIKQSQ